MVSFTPNRRTAWPIQFLTRRFFRIFAIVFGLMPVLPVLVLFGAYLAHLWLQPATVASSLDDAELVGAAVNSSIFGFLAAISGTLLSLLFVLFLNSYKSVAILILCLLFLPGPLVAHGYDVVSARFMFSAVSPFVAPFLLLLALVGYVLPFQALIVLMATLGFGEDERSAVSEYFATGNARAFYWIGRLRAQLIATSLIGFALALTEYPRSQALGHDFFGFGGSYFGPLFMGLYQNQGIPELYIFFASILMAVTLAIVGWPWLRTAPSRAGGNWS